MRFPFPESPAFAAVQYLSPPWQHYRWAASGAGTSKKVREGAPPPPREKSFASGTVCGTNTGLPSSLPQVRGKKAPTSGEDPMKHLPETTRHPLHTNPAGWFKGFLNKWGAFAIHFLIPQADPTRV